MENNFNCWFQSIDDPNNKFPIDEIIYRCPDTGSLLEVAHDMEALKKHDSTYWKDLFDSRYRRQSWPYVVEYGERKNGLSLS